jgi:hypothetical protein
LLCITFFWQGPGEEQQDMVPEEMDEAWEVPHVTIEEDAAADVDRLDAHQEGDDLAIKHNADHHPTQVFS